MVVIERNASTVHAPRAVSLDDESLRTMQAIRLAEAVLRDVAEDYGSFYYTPAGRLFARVEPTTREYGFARRNAFTQPQFEATLLEGVRRFPQVTLLFEHLVDSLQEEPDGVTLRARPPMRKGVPDLMLRATFVVACDGARSATRKHIGATMVGSSYAQRWLIVDLASTRERLRQTRVVCDPDRPMITLPGPGGIRRYEFMLHDDEDEETAIDPAFIQRLLRENGPDAGSPIVRAQPYSFHALIADRWNSARIFLAGDAAHLSPPFAGQGMNSGLRDAFNLGWKLAGVVQGRFGPKLLDTYFEEREPHARELIRLAVSMGRIMMPKSAIQAWGVQAAFRITRFVPSVQSYFSQMKYKPKPFYQRGFLEDSQETKLAGRMLPQPLVELAEGGTIRLDELLGNGCTLLAFGPDAQHRLAEAAGLDFGLDGLTALAVLPGTINPDTCSAIRAVRETNGLLASIVPENRTAVILVRPDRYIAVATFGSVASMASVVKQFSARFVDEVTASPAVRVWTFER